METGERSRAGPHVSGEARLRLPDHMDGLAGDEGADDLHVVRLARSTASRLLKAMCGVTTTLGRDMSSQL